MKFMIPCVLAIATLYMPVVSTMSCAQDNVVIVLDDSGSMNESMRSGGTRIQAAKNALSEVLKHFKSDTKLGVLLLNGARTKEHWVVPLEPLSPDKAIRLVNSVRADGGTPLGDRIRDGADALLRLREKQYYGNYRLLIVTDGEANDSKLLAQYLPDVLSRGIIVDAIGVDMKQDHSLATRVHSYRRADDPIALEKAVQEVFAERVDATNGSSKDDFALLDALDNETAKEVLKELSKPNNSSVVGVSKPLNWGNAVEAVETFSQTAFTGMLLCLVPLLLLLFIVGLVLSKSKINQAHRRRK